MSNKESKWFHPLQKEVDKRLKLRETTGRPLLTHTPESRFRLLHQVVTEDWVYEKFMDYHFGETVVVEYNKQHNDFEIFDQRV